MTTDEHPRHQALPGAEGGMSCRDAAELSPWLLNGSLEAGERWELEAHLAACEGCRRELRQAALAWRVATQHIPSLALAEYAQGVRLPGLEPGGVGRERIERHLGTCPSCREELALASGEKVVDFAAARAERAAGARSPAWRWLAAAASLAAVVASGALVRDMVGFGSPTPDPAGVAVSLEDRQAAFVADAQGQEGERTGIFVEGFESGALTAWSSTSR